ncbi:MAG TPA: sugar ABC transporter permease [Rectinemataceae bacterium]|nr:sugar ABC transporter permease [Rectinemataceae bacterium]
MRHRGLARDGAAPYVFLAPLLVLLAAFIVYPVAMNIVTSFTEWKGYGPWKWTGLANYRTMLADRQFWTSISNTGLMILYIPISTVVTVLIAAFLREGIWGWKLYRAILYIPNLLGYVLMGVIFSIYLRDEGPINAIVRWATGSTIHFLIAPAVAINSVGFILVVWLHLGFGLIYFLAAMNGVDKSIFEAALIDGASFWRTLFQVTIPSIRFAVEFWIVFNFIEVFARMFPFIHTLTQGGPGYSTFTLEYGIFIQAFSKFKVGYSSAWSVVLFLFCAMISVAQIRLMKRRDE